MQRAPIVLASTSPYRQALLRQLRVEFTAVAHRVDERALEAELASLALAPEAVVERLAIAKAQSIAADHPSAVIIGSDQLLATNDGEILGKPGSAARAREQIAGLRGHDHRLITAIAVVAPGADGSHATARTHVDTHVMRIRADLTDAEIAVYVAADNPIDCAGAIKIESLGIALMDRMRGEDYTAIIGLPLMALSGMLRDAGINPLQRQ